jgi:hypothetical protein
MIEGGNGPFPTQPVQGPEEQHIKTSLGCRPKHQLKLFSIAGLTAQPINEFLNDGPGLRARESPKVPQLVLRLLAAAQCRRFALSSLGVGRVARRVSSHRRLATRPSGD